MSFDIKEKEFSLQMNPIFLLAIKISKRQRVTSKESAPLSTLLCWLRVCLNRTYFVETENWKYCSKIIFKCVNSTVRPIFNEKIDKKMKFMGPWAVHKCTVHGRLVKSCGYCSCTVYKQYHLLGKRREKKKKKKENVET